MTSREMIYFDCGAVAAALGLATKELFDLSFIGGCGIVIIAMLIMQTIGSFVATFYRDEK